MRTLAVTDPRLLPIVDDMLHAGPGHSDPDVWATELLEAARRLPNEYRSVRHSSGVRVASMPDVDESTRCSARLIELLADPEASNELICSRMTDVADAGAPLQAVQGIVRLARRARVLSLRGVGELLYLSALALCDGFTRADPLELGHQDSGSDRHATLLRPAIVHMGQGAGSFADYLQQVAPAATDNDPTGLAETALTATVAVLRRDHRIGSGATWLHGVASRGLAFALPLPAISRFAGYRDYLCHRRVHAAWLAYLDERWAHGLMQLGRLHEAAAVIDRGERLLPADEACDPARIQLLRARSRLARFAGDLPLALSLSDRVFALMNQANNFLSDADRAAAWLNRAGVLVESRDRGQALMCARRAVELYRSDGFSIVGEVEARQLEVSADHDRSRAARLAVDLAEREARGELPEPVRASTLWRVGEALVATDKALALQTLRKAAAISDRNRSRVSVLARFTAARALLADDPLEATAWAVEAVVASRRQHNVLLRARAELLLVRGRQATGDLDVGRSMSRTALKHLADCLVGLTAEGESNLLDGVGDDLRAIFDLAVQVDDAPLALQVAEMGRALRLAAVMRLDLERLPTTVREALAQTAFAARVSDTNRAGGPVGSAPSREAVQTALHAASALEAAAGEIFRTVVVDPVMDLAQIRSAFPFAHLLTLSEHDGTIRWAWWPRGAGVEPSAGSRPVPRRLESLLEGYSGGHAALLPGDVVAPLAALLPEPLCRALASAATPVPLMISPMGRLWHVPFAAIPIAGPDGPLLMHKATITLIPSLRLAHDLAEREARRPSPSDQVAGYCNPYLPGAKMEERSLSEIWGQSYRELDGVTSFGKVADISIEVMATHSTNSPGLAQAVVDHRRSALTAGQCITREFSRIVVLGTCHGYGNSDGGNEPIGLLTVISARGATWVAGGHQHLHDATVGWLLSRAYQHLRAGAALPAAIRAAQRTYLDHLASGPDRMDPDLRAIVEQAGGPDAARQPWCWALSVVGPAAPDEPDDRRSSALPT